MAKTTTKASTAAKKAADAGASKSQAAAGGATVGASGGAIQDVAGAGASEGAASGGAAVASAEAAAIVSAGEQGATEGEAVRAEDHGSVVIDVAARELQRSLQATPSGKADYMVISPLEHDGKRYAVDAVVPLSSEHAQPLLGHTVKPVAVGE